MGTRANVLVGAASVSIEGKVVGARGGLTATPITGFYTVDGVVMTVRSDMADIKVEENIGTVKRVLTDQEVTVALTFAEGELENLVAAIPGSYISGNTVTLGGGDPAGEVLQEFELTLVGKNEGGGDRTIVLNEVNPTGEVGIPYKKGEASVIPVTFSALVNDSKVFGTIVDS